jgi:hypothetical protein
MEPTMRVLSRVVREFAAGVDAGHAVRLGLPVRGDALRDSAVRDAAERDGDAGFATSSATSRARA